MKRVVCVLGSARPNSNSQLVAERFVIAAKGRGAATEAFTLNDLTFKGCQGCGRCKTDSVECVQVDGLTPVLKAIAASDVLIVATPIYFGQIAGPLKTLFDRMYSFLTPTFMTGNDVTRLAPGKKLVFVATQGHPDPAVFDAFAAYAYGFGPNALGFEAHVIRGCGLNEPGAAAADAQLLLRADELARAVLA